MKLPKIIFTFFISFVFAAGAGICETASRASSGTSADINTLKLMMGADIKALVQVQIDSAKARDFRGEIKSCMFQLNPKTDLVYQVPLKEFESGSFFADNLRFLIIIGFSGIVFLIVFLRRIKLKNQKFLNKKLKENIKLIREEAPVLKENPELNMLRSRLVNQSADVVVDSVSKKAKGLKIGKGEVMLAAKIKSYQLAHFSSNK